MGIGSKLHLRAQEIKNSIIFERVILKARTSAVTAWGSNAHALAVKHESQMPSIFQPPKLKPREAKEQMLCAALRERMADLGTSPGSDLAEGLLSIRLFSKRCIALTNARTPAFKGVRSGWEPTALGNELLAVLPALAFFATTETPDRALHPHIQVAIDAFHQKGLHYAYNDLFQGFGLSSPLVRTKALPDAIALRCNDFRSDLHARGTGAGAGRDIQRHHDLHTARQREVRTYLTGIAKRYPASRVVRLDLGRRINATSDEKLEFKQTLSVASRYLSSIKKTYGSALVGDVLKIDRGEGSRYQAHCLLVVDGPNSNELQAIKQDLFERWHPEGPGVGYVIDCDNAGFFHYRGSSLESRGLDCLSSQLERASIFLAATDQIISIGYGRNLDGLKVGNFSK